MSNRINCVHYLESWVPVAKGKIRMKLAKMTQKRSWSFKKDEENNRMCEHLHQVGENGRQGGGEGPGGLVKAVKVQAVEKTL